MARRSVDRLSGLLPRDLLYEVRFLLNEAVTNSIVHADAQGDIEVDIQVQNDRVRVEVTDPGGDTDPELRQAGLLETSGRGLVLIQAMSARWGSHVDDTCTVWFELDRR